MSDINKLVEYLNFEYKGEKNEDSTSIIVIDENFGTEESNIKEFLIVDLENNSLFKRLYLNTDFIYLNVSQEETIYYKGQIQANGPILYSNILSVDVWEELDDSNFITVTLNTQSEGFSTSFNAFPDGFYYNYEEATLYYKSLDTAFVYVKSFIFHYFYQDIADISNGTYLLNYKDNEGYTIDFGDSLLKYISETKLQTAISNNQRKITLTKATLSGMVFRFPKIRKGELKYLYKLPEGNFFPRTKFFDNDIAIHLSFATIYGQLEFLNQTIFEYVSYFSEDISGTAGVFYREYSDMVLFELKAAKFDDKLKIIYHLPVFFLVQIDSRDLNLWEVLGEMLENAVTNAGTNKEDIAIKLLRILLEKDGSDMFLENLLTQKTENITFFSLLYEKLNGDNFVKFITFMWQVWIQTKYVLPVNTIYEGFESPWMLPFSSKIQFGFYWSNISVAYTEKENAIQFAYDTGRRETVYNKSTEGKEYVNPVDTVPIKEYYAYHVYQPLLLKDVEGNNQTALELVQKETLVPAFVLKANQEKQFWSNMVTAGEYAIDIVTTFSGVGNVLKFRHLNKLRLLGEVSQTITYVKLAVGVSEITTGSLNLALKLSDLKDTPFGKELSNYLFIIELLSLGGEIAAALKGALAKSADDLLKHEDALRKSTQNADEAKQIDEFINHLLIVSGKIISDITDFLKKLPKNAAIFVSNIAAKVPGLETRIVNGLMEAHFKGVTWFKMNPRGIMLELNFTRKFPKESTYKTPVAELKKVEVELTYLNEKGKEIVKKYTDDIEVLLSKDGKTGIETFTFRPKFEEGKVRDTDFINYTFKRTEEQVLDTGEIIYKEPPYAVKPTSRSKAVDKILKEGDEFYIVEYMNRERPGGFATNIEITTEKELRKLLQVTEDMKKTLKDNPFVVRQYRVREGQQLYTREGYIGSLKTMQATGPKQWEFLELWDIDFEDNVLEVINVKNLK